MTYTQIWQEDGWQQIWESRGDNDIKLLIADVNVKAPATQTITEILDLTRRVVFITYCDDSSLTHADLTVPVQIEGTRRHKYYQHPVSPCLANWLIKQWGYKTVYLTDGKVTRTDKSGFTKVVESQPRGRYKSA